MKKKGAALVTVLVIFTALIIVGTSISSAVINTTKLNKRYSDTIDLELAAKSGVNIIKEDFISKVNNGDIKTLDNVKTYINEVNNGSLSNLFKEYFKNDNIELELKLDLDSSDSKYRLKITSTAKSEGKVSVEKVEKDSLVLNIRNESTGTGESGGTNTGETGTGDGNDTGTGGTGIGGNTSGGDLSVIKDENVALIIADIDNIKSLKLVNNGVIIANEKKKYDSYSNSNNPNFFNNEKVIDGTINISVPEFGIENSTDTKKIFYLTSDGITYDSNHGKQEYYEMKVDDEYEINHNYNSSGFIVVKVDGDLEICGKGNAHNFSKPIIYVVNGNVSLDSRDTSLNINQMAIMARSIKNIGSKTIGFNSGLLITKELYLPDGHINAGTGKALSIINEIIQGKSID